MKYMKREQGFTLIELLVVIAILGIRAAVVIPAVAGFIGEGEDESAETELHNVNLAVTALMADPDRPCSRLDELANSLVECNQAAHGVCTQCMGAGCDAASGPVLASLDDGSGAAAFGAIKYGINNGSDVADYMEYPDTTYWYCTTIRGRVIGYQNGTCLAADLIGQ